MDLDYLSSLNDNQRKAVQTTEGYLRVIAGAGQRKNQAVGISLCLSGQRIRH